MPEPELFYSLGACSAPIKHVSLEQQNNMNNVFFAPPFGELDMLKIQNLV